MSFVFFDTETTGLRKGFDQILHFAAIRVDHELNELDRFEARSRLMPHVVPHPSALKTNGLSIKQLTDKTLPSHYEMVRSIRQKLLSWPPAIYVGYNSIRFDEEMLRHALFQTLHPAYLTSSHNNCRADALGLVMAAAAATPSCLSIPSGPEGRPTFKLDLIAPANGISHGKAHDAMADVMATLQLCRFLREPASDLWQRFVRFSKKSSVADFVDSENGFFLSEFHRNEARHWPVVCIGTDPDQPNGRLCLRLDSDAERFAALPDVELGIELHRQPSPVRRLRINAAPTLTSFDDAPVTMIGEHDLSRYEAGAGRIKGDPDFRNRLIRLYVETRTPFAPPKHIEHRLYEGFPGYEDEMRMASFHDADWPEALSIVESFDDIRLRAFGRRLIYFERRSILPEPIRLEIDRDLAHRLTNDNDDDILSLGRALQETDRMLVAGEALDDPNINEFRTYLVDRIKRVENFRSLGAEPKGRI